MQQTSVHYQDPGVECLTEHSRQAHRHESFRTPLEDEVLGGFQSEEDHLPAVSPDSPEFLRARRLAELRFYFLKLALWWTGLTVMLLVINLRFYPNVKWAQWPALLWLTMLIHPFCKSYVFCGEDLRTVINRRLDLVAMRSARQWQE